jgi:outer membrane protein assembly factor BamA
MIRILVSVLLLATSAFAQAHPIVSIEANGSARYKAAEIVAASGLKADIGKPVPLSAVRDAAQKLVDSGVFSDLSYRHSAVTGGMDVQFIVKDKAADQFLPAVFENIIWLSETELRDELQKRVPLFHGDIPLAGRLGDEVAEAVGAILKSRNIDAHVTSAQSCVSGEKSCTRNFTVDNIQIETEELKITGAPAEIAAEIQAAAKKNIVGKPYVRSRTDKEFTQLIRAACLRRGLLKPEIRDLVAAPSHHSGDGVGVALSASVVPGAAYRFEGQQWTGNTAIDSAALAKMVHLYQHLPVDGAKLESDLERARQEFAYRGYMQAVITAQPEFDDQQGAVKYNFVVKQGPLYKMGKLDVSGFPYKVSEEVTTLWKLREGDPFDRSYVLRFFGEPKIMQMFADKPFVVEQSEGETEHVVDVSIVLCHPSGCQPSPNALFVSGEVESDSKPESQPK